MKFVSTRSNRISVSATRAVAEGVANDGGLFVPLSLPTLEARDLRGMLGLTLAERMKRVLALFFDDIDIGGVVDGAEIADGDLLKTEDGLFMLDLTDGATGRAEDIALPVFARLLAACRKKEGMERVAFVPFAGGAEAGRTFLHAFDGVKGVAAMAFYPENTDKLRLRGILDASCENARAVGVKGDSYADILRECEYDKSFGEAARSAGYDVVAASELNIGRVLPYIAAFVSAYCDLVDAGEIELGDRINFALPAADLCMAMAGCYAKLMGLPIARLVLAANANNAVVELVNEYRFNADRTLYLTLAHELDMLIPSHLERLVYELCGRDSEATAEAMGALFDRHAFEIEPDKRCEIYDAVQAGWADEDELKEAAFNFFDIDDVTLDPIAAVTASVYNAYSCETEDDASTVLVMTTNPYIDPRGTLEALGTEESDPMKAAVKLELLTALDIPECVERLRGNTEREQPDGLVKAEWMREVMIAFLKELA